MCVSGSYNTTPDVFCITPLPFNLAMSCKKYSSNYLYFLKFGGSILVSLLILGYLLYANEQTTFVDTGMVHHLHYKHFLEYFH